MFSSNGSQVSNDANYIEDVFSTYLYQGTGANQTITNNIDLSTKGGLVWTQSRTGGVYNCFADTARGVNKYITSQSTSAEGSSSSYVNAFNTNGFTGGVNVSTSGHYYGSWTFRKQPKFFDVVTYTGNGSTKVINHTLGSIPGCVIVKKTSSVSGVGWVTYHRITGVNKYLLLNATDAAADATGIFSDMTSTTFGVGNYSDINESGATYVAYLFAHDAGGFGLTGTDNVISCGSYNWTANTDINLGWEPQFILTKETTGTYGGWRIVDNMRGLHSVEDGNQAVLNPNAASAEGMSNTGIGITSTGFRTSSDNNSGMNFIYIAIRRGPMKVPTDATKVFAPVARTGTGADANITNGFVTDLVISQARGNVGSDPSTFDRLRGATIRLRPDSAGSELTATDSLTSFASMTGVAVGADSSTQSINWSGAGGTYVTWSFQRAPSFFDEVCYTGTGSTTTITHNLGVAPELIIVKRRNSATAGLIYSAATGIDKYLALFDGASGNIAAATYSGVWGSATPTASVFGLGSLGNINASSGTYVAYLFATCAGVSKVGSYTGTGTTKQVDCGFAAGARFVLIKRTDSTGDWYVWDTARGIVSGNDPYLLLNSTAAETTTTDYIDTYAAGFELSSTAPAALNASGGTYIFLAIA